LIAKDKIDVKYEEIKMKTLMKTLTIVALTTGLALVSVEGAPKKGKKKNAPKTRRVAQDLIKTAGGDKHFPPKTKLSQVGSAKIGATYYHVYVGKLKKGGFHAYVFDNTPKYLGYYKLQYEPTDCEDGKKEGAILVDLEESDDFDSSENTDGESAYLAKIRIKEHTGPVDNTKINNQYVKFVPAPKKKMVSSLVKKDSKPLEKPVCREWSISKKGKVLKVRATFVKRTFGKVLLRGEASGNEVWLANSSLPTKADQDYIKKYPVEKE